MEINSTIFYHLGFREWIKSYEYKLIDGMWYLFVNEEKKFICETTNELFEIFKKEKED